jgi:hypothetical protein
VRRPRVRVPAGTCPGAWHLLPAGWGDPQIRKAKPEAPSGAGFFPLMADEIEEAAAVRRRTGAEPLGVAKILAQDPETRPQRVKKSPAPLLHAASKEIRQIFYEGFALFVAAYRVATEKLLKGEPNQIFPLGCFPPALPFVGSG